jgi:hypothetical protein
MATIENRINKIEKSLTPKQAIVGWMEEAHRFNSLSEYAVWSAGRPEEEPTDLKRLTQRVEIAVRDRMKGEHEVRVQRAVRAAVSEVGFLYFLCLAVNGQFAAQCQSIALLGVLSLERASAALRETTGTQSPVDRDRYDTWHEDFRSYAIQVFALKAAIEQIAKQYFDNNQVLWKSFTEQLENFIRFVNLITNKWEDAFYSAYWNLHSEKKCRLGDRQQKPPHFNFDLERLRQSIDPKNIVKSLVLIARADTLSVMGDNLAAVKLSSSLLRGVTTPHKEA